MFSKETVYYKQQHNRYPKCSREWIYKKKGGKC